MAERTPNTVETLPAFEMAFLLLRTFRPRGHFVDFALSRVLV